MADPLHNEFPPGSLEARDLEHVFHPTTNLKLHQQVGPMVHARAQGVYLWDGNGKQYLEGMAGLWCTALGYGEEELVRVAEQQMRKLCYSQLFAGKTNEPSVLLAEKLKAMVPMPADKVFFGLSGSDANDTQVKLLWYYNNAMGRPEKKKIISRLRGYHGVTVAAGSLTGLPAFHKHFDLPIQGVLHTGCPHYYRGAQGAESEIEFVDRLVAELEDLISREGGDTIAAFIAEPVMGAGGVIVPFDIKPTTMSLAKAISSAYLPISAVMVPEFMYETVAELSGEVGTFGHGFTYSGHPVCAAVALRNIELMEERDIFTHAGLVGEKLQERLAVLADHPLVGEVRGVGLIAAVELVQNKDTRSPFPAEQSVGAQVAARCEEHGLILRALGDSIAICPPLIITADQVDELVNKLETALNEVLSTIR
jgi:4-aminobutyrate--pyruvate transaminase